MPPTKERVIDAGLPVEDAARVVLDAVNRASSQEQYGNFRVAGGDAAGTIAVSRNPVVEGEDGRIHETSHYTEACVGPLDADIDGFFGEEEGTVIGIDSGLNPGLTFRKGNKEWVYGSRKPPKKFVLKALIRLGLSTSDFKPA